MRCIALSILVFANTIPAVAQEEAGGAQGQPLPVATYLPVSTTWHLLTSSYGGTISLIKNLNKHECEFAKARALGLPATPEEKKAHDEASARWSKDHPGEGRVTSRILSDGDIKSAECFE